MKLDSKRKKLKNLYFELLELELPKFSSSDELSNWIEELIEIDAYYAGLALFVSEEKKIPKQELYNIENLDKEFNSIKPKNKEDIFIIT